MWCLSFEREKLDIDGAWRYATGKATMTFRPERFSSGTLLDLMRTPVRIEGGVPLWIEVQLKQRVCLDARVT